MKTRESLEIFWDGEEVEGALFYGLWPGALVSPPAPPIGLWPSDTEFMRRRLWGQGWTVWLLEVRIRSWPAEERWSAIVRGTLEAVLSAGAEISWCAVEGCFVDPPSLFDPTEMGEGVWSCRSKGGADAEAPALDGPFYWISRHVLAHLQSDATNLLNRAEKG